MTISIPRLRRFIADADAAHAALMAAGEKVRLARKNCQAAQYALTIFNDSRPQISSKDHKAEDRTHERLEADVAASELALQAAEAARADVYERYDLARSLASRGRDYVASLGLLPTDLVEA